MPRDRKRIVRALEVYIAMGRTLTDHFSETASLIADCEIVSIALRLPAALTAERVARRANEQFARGIVGEVKALLARGVPPDARPFGGLVYRQVMEMLGGVRDEEATRALIAQENRRYARRQLIWFRKEPTLIWFDGPGERDETLGPCGRRAYRTRVPDREETIPEWPRLLNSVPPPDRRTSRRCFSTTPGASASPSACS